MKHKLCVWLATLLALCLCLPFAGCADVSAENEGDSGTTPPHTHTFAAGWSHDEEKHWHAATCGHDTQRSGEAAHTYVNGKCTECNYEHEAHVYGAYDKTESGHSQTCTVCGKVVTGQHNYENGKCTTCEYEHVSHAFEYSNKTETEHTGTCTVCGKTVTEDHTYEKGICSECNYAHQNHNYGADNTCSVCGAGFYTKSADGKKVYFGEYPQTEVTDANDSDMSLRNSLNMDAGVPSAGNAGKWTDYGYYIYGAVSEFMWYIDVEYQGSRYRGVYFTNYRPENTRASSSKGNSYQDNNGYETNTVYWFQYEPIEWRILDEKDGTALLMANIILDSQQYYCCSDTRTIDGETVYPNNYKESDIRAWLTGTFYETAFDEYAKRIIETTTVDNSASTTASNSNPYVCSDTQDKVFLLSWKELVTSTYGFESQDLTEDTARQLKSTDYAKSQGVFVSSDSSFRGVGWWWLRSPWDILDNFADDVYFDGKSNDSKKVDRTHFGVVPALWIKL